MQKIVVLFMLMTAATASFSAESIEVASREKSPLQAKNTVALPSINESYEYYEVCGCSEEELHCDLKKKCIQENNGKKFDSVTAWDVKWDYDHDSSPGTCAADSFKVTVNILYRLPKWARTEDAPRQLVGKWDSYLKNLILHENGHRDMVVEATADLNRAVADLPPAPTCAELDRRVRTLCRDRMDRLNEDQKRYDTITNHGVTQGALFP